MGLWDIEKIPYIGREKGPQEGLAFHYYDADKVVAGKKMKDWLRFGVAWWHTFMSTKRVLGWMAAISLFL